MCESRKCVCLINPSASTGVVNIYETSEIASHSGFDENIGLLPVTPKPLRELMNLTTSVSTMTFNHDAQILAIASDKKKDAFRMVCTSLLVCLRHSFNSSVPLRRSICRPQLPFPIGQRHRHRWALSLPPTSPPEVNTWQLETLRARSCCMGSSITGAHEAQCDYTNGAKLKLQ